LHRFGGWSDVGFDMFGNAHQLLNQKVSPFAIDLDSSFNGPSQGYGGKHSNSPPYHLRNR
ncbi:unnamed protein product, partial [Amoebophrya sp. A120]